MRNYKENFWLTLILLLTSFFPLLLMLLCHWTHVASFLARCSEHYICKEEKKVFFPLRSISRGMQSKKTKGRLTGIKAFMFYCCQFFWQDIIYRISSLCFNVKAVSYKCVNAYFYYHIFCVESIKKGCHIIEN